MAKKKGRSPKKKSRSQASYLGRFREILAGTLFGQKLDDELDDRLTEIKGLLLISFALWFLISLATYYTPYIDPAARPHNWGGQLGFYLADYGLIFSGYASYLVVALAFFWGCVVVARHEVSMPAIRILGGLLLVFSTALMMQLAFGPTHAELNNELPYGHGGWLAKMIAPQLVGKFGDPGLWVILLTMTAISFMLATEMAFYPAIKAMGSWANERREQWGENIGPALWGWFRGLVGRLWDFLRGADLQTASEGTAAKAGRKKPARKKALASEDSYFEEDESEEGAEEEWAEDEEYEYEYEEDGEEEWEESDPAEGEAAEVWAEGDEYEEESEEESEAEEESEYDYEYAFDEEEGEEFVETEPIEEVIPVAAAVKKLPQPTAIKTPVYSPPTPPPGEWTLPPPDLLEPPGEDIGHDSEFLEASARALETALKSFRVDAEVVGAQVGPAVTLFELTVASGTRMNRVTQLSQEIAATLRAESVRIIAPIPGKSTIGIEVPNSKRRTVRISELVHEKAYDPKFAALPLFLGMDAEGNAIVEDLAAMPHLLIAGTTGSGKSVCINTIIASFLLTRSPHDVRLILVDPKMVELQMFENVPHLELPVVTDMRQATAVLQWAVEKMEGRYELFKDAGVKNIKSFNGLGEEKLRERLGEHFHEERTPRHMPYIVVIIDEMADLMMQSKKEAEQAITRLAQKSRAVGIHVIVATQRPSTDVITGVIKGNLPTRIAFQVASKIDSRVILDEMGAEKLLGQGDMLYNPPQSSSIRRVQGALVEDHELQRLVDFVTRDSIQSFNQELIQTASGTAAAGNPVEEAIQQDDLFDQAVRVILKSRRGSASLLQRALGIGYTRASRLIDMMTTAGIVGEHKGSKAREILMTLDDWEEMLGTCTSQGTNDG